MTIQPKPKTIALTGSRMSGKNKVAQVWKDTLGIPIFEADLAFRFTISYDEDIRSRVKKEFGSSSFIKDWINPSFFDTDEKMKKLLEIAEERVFEMFFKWRKRQTTKYVIFKCSAIHELMNPRNFSKIVSVYAPKDVRQMRYGRLYGIDSDIILEDEFPAELKKDRSDHVVHNYYGFSNRINRQLNAIHKNILSDIS